MPRGVKRIVREDGTTWCSKGHHWVHLTGFYLKGVKYLAWNLAHTEQVWYGKPTNSWCKDCIAGRTPGVAAEDHGEPGAIDWDNLSAEEQAKLVAEYRKADIAETYRVERVSPPPSGTFDDLPYQRPPEYALEDDDEEPSAPGIVKGSDGYEYPADPEARMEDAKRRLQGGLIDYAEFDRVTD